MKRYIMYAIGCIGILAFSAIFYSSIARQDDSSILSDQQMAQITGAGYCACYEDGWHTTCRVAGSMECDIDGDECPDEAYKFSNAYLYQVTSSGSPNGKVPDYYWAPCYTKYSVDWVGDHYGEECYNGPHPDYDPDEHSGWWYYCRTAIGEWCTVCEWGDPLESSYMYKSWFCKSI